MPSKYHIHTSGIKYPLKSYKLKSSKVVDIRFYKNSTLIYSEKILGDGQEKLLLNELYDVTGVAIVGGGTKIHL